MIERLNIVHLIGDVGIEDALSLRKQVFSEEMRIPAEVEPDGQDDQAEHYVGYLGNDEAVAMARIRFIHPSLAAVSIDRLAVARDQRRRGFGSQLLEGVLANLRERNQAETIAADLAGRKPLHVMHVELEAPKHLLDFYRQLGFIATGEEYTDESDIVLRSMYRPLGY